MARQVHTAQIPLGSVGDYSVPDSADLTFIPSDVGNQEETKLTGKEMIVVRNINVGAISVSIDSVDDPFRRAENIVNYAIQANQFAIFGPFDRTGWIQPDGTLHFSTSNADALIAVVRLPELNVK